MRANAIIVLLLGLSCLSCRRTEPPFPAGGKPDERFVELYARMLIAREECALAARDSGSVRHLEDSLFASFGMTRNRFEDTLGQYRKDPAGWKDLLERVSHRLEALQREQVPEGKPRPETQKG